MVFGTVWIVRSAQPLARFHGRDGLAPLMAGVLAAIGGRIAANELPPNVLALFGGTTAMLAIYLVALVAIERTVLVGNTMLLLSYLRERAVDDE